MLEFILNDQLIRTEAAPGMAVLDFVRNQQQLKGSKLVCKEGECGACSMLVGKLESNKVQYESMTSCIMPLANAQGKHLVTVEGLNMEELSPVQQAIVDQYGSQCGFCTPGFVVALSGYVLTHTHQNIDEALSSMCGNICRCTGYKSLERAAAELCDKLQTDVPKPDLNSLIEANYIPAYFSKIANRLANIETKPTTLGQGAKLGGGTDLYVQKPRDMYAASAQYVYDEPSMNEIALSDGICTFGASLTMGDLERSSIFRKALPDADYIFKLLSSAPIRNMSTIGGNLANASPIGDFSILLLALDADLTLNQMGSRRTIKLSDFFKSYKIVDLQENEHIERIAFSAVAPTSLFHFEKISQRKYFDIATVNLAAHITLVNDRIESAQLAIGGVGPIPMYLFKTVQYLKGKSLNSQTIDKGIEMLNTEISPISDARGSASYKRLLARQLFIAAFLRINKSVYPVRKLINA